MTLMDLVGRLVLHIIILTVAWYLGDIWAYRRGYRQGRLEGLADVAHQPDLRLPPDKSDRPS